MKKLEYIVVHCTVTPEGRDVKAETVVKWHTDPTPTGNGWMRPGYSNIIELDGTLVNVFRYNNDGWVQADEVTNGAKGYNAKSRHICYVGGVERNNIKVAKDTRTLAQIETMKNYLIKAKTEHPHVKIIGHNDLNPDKACPSFNVKEWFAKVWSEHLFQKRFNAIGNLDPKKERRI
jgi:N-acetylmuramoyl-L-alanine amidase